MPYAEVFTSDGRILTKITPERKAILDRFQGNTFGDIAQTFWVGKRGNTIEAWAIEKPPNGRALRWEELDMLRRGAVFRGEIHEASDAGLDIFKGENIVACRVEGDPIKKKIDIQRVDDPSLWRFRDILPRHGFAFHQIATALTCAPFDPRQIAFLDTGT